MTSTSFNIGMSSDRSSSRVLKPPGGGHTNIFGESEVKVNSPRPKYDQQNSSNLNFCMNTTDPNLLVEQVKHEVQAPSHSVKSSEPEPKSVGNGSSGVGGCCGGNNMDSGNYVDPTANQTRGSRIPPGGFSSGGFW